MSDEQTPKPESSEKMHPIVLDAIRDGAGGAVLRYMESIGFKYQGGCGVNDERTGRFVRVGEGVTADHLRVVWRVEEVRPEDRIDPT